MKRMDKVKNIFMLALLFCSTMVFSNLKVSSPDGSVAVYVGVENGSANYSVEKSGKVVLNKSNLGFEFKNMPVLNKNFTLAGSKTSSFDETWEQPWGERRFVRNNYNELIVSLQENAGAKRNLNVIFRVFNDGFGFRYEIPKQASVDSIIIADEKTEFNFPADHKAWWIPVHSENSFYESIYRNTNLTAIDTANTPFTIETNDGLFLAIHEANLTDYASMVLLRKDNSNFVSYLVPWANGVKVYAKAPMATPWRTMIIGEKPGDLVTSYMMLNLNEPNKLGDVSYAKPIKYIGIWWAIHLEKYTWSQGPKHGATTENTMRYIDFAAENGFKGVLVEGWNYGWDNTWYEDGSGIKFAKPYPDFDIEKICAYGASKGVKLIGHHETGGFATNYENQLDEAYTLDNKNGITSVKTGYVNKYLDGKEWHDGQYGVRHYRKVIQTAAKYGIAIDNHEPVKPTGLQRTYPNLMTQEGARGQEYDAWSADGGNPPSHTTILPFTRMLAGPFDFTAGTFNMNNPVKPNTRVQTTRAKQLAMFVIIYSPLQMASDLPENYEGQEGLQFIKDVPCDWEETRVLDAKIGQYVVMARKDRNTESWYLGAITNEDSRKLTVDLSFLDAGKEYTAQIYADGENADWKTNPNALKITEMTVSSTSKINIAMATSGGAAIRLIKK